VIDFEESSHALFKDYVLSLAWRNWVTHITGITVAWH